MQRRAVTAAVFATSRRHAGVLTAADLGRLGANSRQIHQLVADGILSRWSRGVYVVSGTQRDHALDVRAALARAPAGTIASHASAAWLQGALENAPAVVHLLSPTRAAGWPGTTLHYGIVLPRPARFHGVPCTPPARTLLDLAADLAPAQLADAVDRALARGVVRLADLAAEVERANGRRGSAQLRRCIAELGPYAAGHRGGPGTPPPSVLESRMRRLLHRYGLPDPEVEHVAGPEGEYRIDFTYPRWRVAVETYGYAWHHSPAQMQHDLERQRRLTLDGWTILVFTWKDVTETPERVAKELRTALQGTNRPEPRNP